MRLLRSLLSWPIAVGLLAASCSEAALDNEGSLHYIPAAHEPIRLAVPFAFERFIVKGYVQGISARALQEQMLNYARKDFLENVYKQCEKIRILLTASTEDEPKEDEEHSALRDFSVLSFHGCHTVFTEAEQEEFRHVFQRAARELDGTYVMFAGQATVINLMGAHLTLNPAIPSRKVRVYETGPSYRIVGDYITAVPEAGDRRLTKNELFVTEKHGSVITSQVTGVPSSLPRLAGSDEGETSRSGDEEPMSEVAQIAQEVVSEGVKVAVDEPTADAVVVSEAAEIAEEAVSEVVEVAATAEAEAVVKEENEASPSGLSGSSDVDGNSEQPLLAENTEMPASSPTSEVAQPIEGDLRPLEFETEVQTASEEPEERTEVVKAAHASLVAEDGIEVEVDRVAANEETVVPTTVPTQKPTDCDTSAPTIGVSTDVTVEPESTSSAFDEDVLSINNQIEVEEEREKSVVDELLPCSGTPGDASCSYTVTEPIEVSEPKSTSILLSSGAILDSVPGAPQSEIVSEPTAQDVMTEIPVLLTDAPSTEIEADVPSETSVLDSELPDSVISSMVDDEVTEEIQTMPSSNSGTEEASLLNDDAEEMILISSPLGVAEDAFTRHNSEEVPISPAISATSELTQTTPLSTIGTEASVLNDEEDVLLGSPSPVNVLFVGAAEDEIGSHTPEEVATAAPNTRAASSTSGLPLTEPSTKMPTTSLTSHTSTTSTPTTPLPTNGVTSVAPVLTVPTVTPLIGGATTVHSNILVLPAAIPSRSEVISDQSQGAEDFSQHSSKQHLFDEATTAVGGGIPAPETKAEDITGVNTVAKSIAQDIVFQAVEPSPSNSAPADASAVTPTVTETNSATPAPSQPSTVPKIIVPPSGMEKETESPATEAKDEKAEADSSKETAAEKPNDEETASSASASHPFSMGQRVAVALCVVFMSLIAFY